MTRAVALLLTVLTGFSGLVYEVTWQRYLATLLGVHSEATSAVLAIFLGGLSLGYWLFGALCRRLIARARRTGAPPRLLVAYGAAEAGIGVLALLFPWTFELARAASLQIPASPEALAFALDVAVCGLLIGPPAVLMGGTIPVLTQALARSASESTRLHARVYALNTVGAFFGALAAGFVLIPAFGLVSVMIAMGFLNLAVGLVFAGLGLRAGGAPGQSETAGLRPSEERLAAPAAPVGETGSLAVVALLAGFAMMAIQTVLIRLGALTLGSSAFTFSMVVAIFILCIALGSLFVSALERVPRWLLLADLWLLVFVLYLVYSTLPHAPYGAHILRTLFRSIEPAIYAFYGWVFVLMLALVGPAVVLSGALLPLLFDHQRREAGELGAVAGSLYGWNTLGSLIGALLGGYALLFWLDLHHVYRLAVAALAVATVIVAVRTEALSWVSAGALILLPTLGALALLEPWDPVKLSRGLFRARVPTPNSYLGPDAMVQGFHKEWRLVFYDDDPVSSIAIQERRAMAQPPILSLINSGKSEGNSVADYPTMGLLAVIPAMLADTVGSAFVIGYGTGVTAGEIAILESTREVVVAEISPGVVAAAPLFDGSNHGASSHPKVRIVRSDAYRALERDDACYDLILSEPSSPWVAGVEMLYSREFLSAAKERLAPGGIFAQWYHQYESNDATVALVLRTYATVFDDVAVWFARGSDLILLGVAGPAPDPDAVLDRLEERVVSPAFAPALRRSGVQSLAGLLSHELVPFGVISAAGLEGEVHTLYRPTLADRAARAFFVGGEGNLPFTGAGAAAKLGAERSLLGRYRARAGGRLSDADFDAVVRPLCRERSRECLTALASWRRDRPDSATLARTLARVDGKPPFFGPNLSVGVSAELVPLFGSDGLPGSARPPVGPADANRITELYTVHYSHAFPFSPDALLDAWERCDVSDAEAHVCREGALVTRRILGLQRK